MSSATYSGSHVLPPARPLTQEIKDKVKPYLALLFDLAVAALPFPRGEDIPHIEVLRSHTVELCLIYHVKVLSSAADLPTLIRSLYRGTRHTFHNLRLLRYLVHAHVRLLCDTDGPVCRDEMDEGVSAVEAYLFLHSKLLNKLIEREVKRREDVFTFRKRRLTSIGTPPGVTPQSGSFSFAAASNLPSPALSELQMLDQEQKNIDKDIFVNVVGSETILDFIGIILAGIRIVLLLFNKDEAKLSEALSQGEKAIKVLTKEAASSGSYGGSSEIGDNERSLVGEALEYFTGCVAYGYALQGTVLLFISQQKLKFQTLR